MPAQLPSARSSTNASAKYSRLDTNAILLNALLYRRSPISIVDRDETGFRRPAVYQRIRDTRRADRRGSAGEDSCRIRRYNRPRRQPRHRGNRKRILPIRLWAVIEEVTGRVRVVLLSSLDTRNNAKGILSVRQPNPYIADYTTSQPCHYSPIIGAQPAKPGHDRIA
jgi:hypothetical protein